MLVVDSNNIRDTPTKINFGPDHLHNDRSQLLLRRATILEGTLVGDLLSEQSD